MGLGDGHPAFAEARDTRCSCLGVSTEALDVIVQVIADDEDDIRPLILRVERGAGERGSQRECRDRQYGTSCF